MINKADDTNFMLSCFLIERSRESFNLSPISKGYIFNELTLFLLDKLLRYLQINTL